jgi:hypothetical protein
MVENSYKISFIENFIFEFQIIEVFLLLVACRKKTEGGKSSGEVSFSQQRVCGGYANASGLRSQSRHAE